MAKVQIPNTIGGSLSFRWFVEYVVDNSPLFKTASSIAKVASVLAGDLDSVGLVIDINEPAHKLLREALTSEENPMDLPVLNGTRTDEDGKVTEFILPPRLLMQFVSCLLTEPNDQSSGSDTRSG